MTITNLKALYKAQVDSVASDLENAHTDLLANQMAYEKKKSAYADAVNDVVDLEKKIRDIRKKSGSASNAATMEDFADQLRTKITELRAAEVSRISARKVLTFAEIELKKADDLFVNLKARLQKVKKALSDETDRREQLDKWITTLEEVPLSTLKDLAAAVIADDDSADADADADAGDDDAGDAEDDSGNGEDDSGDGGNEDTDENDDTDTIEADRTAYKEAKTRVETDIPEALRNSAADRRNVFLNEYKNAASDLKDAENSLANARESHEGGEGIVAKATLTLGRAQKEFTDYVLTAGEKYDLAISLFKKVNASASLTDAEKSEIADASASAEATIAIPGHIWDNFADFHRATNILEDLAMVSPVTLLTNLTNAEKALVAAVSNLAEGKAQIVDDEKTKEVMSKRFEYVAGAVHEAIRISVRTT